MNIDSYIKSPLPFEEEIYKYFRKNDHIIIFEIGSCEGEDTIRLRRKFPNSVIHTFEPLPDNMARIKNNFKKYSIKNTHLNQLALSNEDGAAKFYVSSGHPEDLPQEENWDYGNKSSSLLKPKQAKKIYKWLEFKNKIRVQTQRLDTYCNKNDIDKIDFVYMDVQGAELMVLEGAGEMINSIGMIWMEVETVELYSHQPLKEDVEEFMIKNGFICIKDVVDKVSGDQLYIRSDLRVRRGLLPKN